MDNPKGKFHYDERATLERIHGNRFRVLMDGTEIGFVYRKSRAYPYWKATGSPLKYTRKQAVDFLIFAKILADVSASVELTDAVRPLQERIAALELQVAAARGLVRVMATLDNIVTSWDGTEWTEILAALETAKQAGLSQERNP